ncbi:MAG: hypothetical protein ACRD3C_21780 [Vicinamibacterales bacterium]
MTLSFRRGIVVLEGAMVTWDIQRDGHAWGGEAMSRRAALSVSTPVNGA